MQSKTVLQPNASGASNSSPKSKKKRPPEIEIYGGKGVTIYYRDGIPTVKNFYEKSEDQALFRKLRKEGQTAVQAREAMKLMGIYPATRASEDQDSYWYAESERAKKNLPHYFGRRRF